MSKDPALRHPTVSAFRYELNAVMNMLGMTKRAQRARRDPTVEQLFVESRLAQALITERGDVEMANDAFRALHVDLHLDLHLDRQPDLGRLVLESGTFADLIARARSSGAPVAGIVREDARSLLVVVTPLEGRTHVVICSPP